MEVGEEVGVWPPMAGIFSLYIGRWGRMGGWIGAGQARGRGTLGSCCICPGTKGPGCRLAQVLLSWDDLPFPSPALTAYPDVIGAKESWTVVSFLLSLSCLPN